MIDLQLLKEKFATSNDRLRQIFTRCKPMDAEFLKLRNMDYVHAARALEHAAAGADGGE